MKWYKKVPDAILGFVFLPLLLLFMMLAFVSYLIHLPEDIKEYKNSHYYKAFKVPFLKTNVMHSPQYKFYNSAINRKLPVKYIRDGLKGVECFVHQNTLFLFPEFDFVDFDEENSVWTTDTGRLLEEFEQAIKKIGTKLDNNEYASVKFLVERKMVLPTDLSNVNIPECVFLTWSYETAFENEDSPLKLIVPENTEELYDMMCKTSDLCGTFEIREEGNIYWNLYDDIQVEIGVDPRDCYIGVTKKQLGKIAVPLTHWHPTIYEVYEDVCAIGKSGNILVVKKRKSVDAVLYKGKKDNCPSSIEYQNNNGTIYYLEAK